MRLGFGFLELYSWAHLNKLNSPSPGADAKAAEYGGNLKAGLTLSWSNIPKLGCGFSTNPKILAS